MNKDNYKERKQRKDTTHLTFIEKKPEEVKKWRVNLNYKKQPNEPKCKKRN